MLTIKCWENFPIFSLMLGTLLLLGKQIDFKMSQMAFHKYYHISLNDKDYYTT